MHAFLLFVGTYLPMLQDDGGDAAATAAAMASSGVSSLCSLALAVVVIAGMWKVFSKAGKPGWAAIIPFYNIYTLLQITGRPTWWILLFFVPCVNIVVLVMICMDVAKAFGRSQMFGVGLALLSFIFFPVLGFGDSKFMGTPTPAAM